MKKLLPVFVLAAVVCGSVVTVLGQSDVGELADHMREVRAKVIQKRDSALRTLLPMTEEQAKTFWPLQKAYDDELRALAEEDWALLERFNKVHKQLTAESAAEIGRGAFDIERRHLALQEKYLERISKAVSPVVAVLFLQLERRFEAELERERMKYSPLAE